MLYLYAFRVVLGSTGLKAVYTVAVAQNGHPVDVAFAVYKQQVVQRRFIMALLFAVSAYFFTEFALRPVKKAADLQRRFIAIVSHELRTPLTIIKNTSEVALRNPATLSQDKAIRVIESNLEEANRLSETVQLLLTFYSCALRNAFRKCRKSRFGGREESYSANKKKKVTNEKLRYPFCQTYRRNRSREFCCSKKDVLNPR